MKSVITLHSGIKFDGVLSVRTSDKTVYVISFPDENGKLIDIPLQPYLVECKKVQLKKLVTIMKKKFNEISPVEYKTLFKFKDGTILEGIIYL